MSETLMMGKLKNPQKVKNSWLCEEIALVLQEHLQLSLWHMNETEPLIILCATPVVFPAVTGQKICCETWQSEMGEVTGGPYGRRAS